MLEKKFNRRGFIKTSSIAAVGTSLLPTFVSPWSKIGNSFKGKKLIIIQFSGGNDGLNTIIPYRNDILYKLRPTLAYSQNKILKVTDEIGFNPAMKEFQNIFENDDLAILNNVGYPKPNRSHFRSMDIWHSASNSDQYLNTGWIGRFLDLNANYLNSLNGIEISETLDLVMKGNTVKGLPLKNIEQFYNAAKQVKIGTNKHEHDLPGFLYKTISDTKNLAEYIYNNTRLFQSRVEYPNTFFSKNLQTISTMINSDLECVVYYMTLNGFDTHNNQQGKQERLLKQYSEGLSSFIQDLKSTGNWKDCLIMTFSEFGRRVPQNASQGTDHGKANNMFIMGGALKQSGFLNPMPDLLKLNEGDIPYEIDFRQVYATILDNWLEVDHREILGKPFAKLNFI